MSAAGAKSFPQCEDGDVEIRLSRKPKDLFILHSFILCLHSPFFKASLSERWTTTSAAGSASKWKYELRFEEGSNTGIVVRTEGNPPAAKVDSANGETAHIILSADPWAPKTKTRTQAWIDVIEAHRRLFNIFYYKPCGLPTSSYPELKGPLMSLLAVADTYFCTQVIQIQIDSFLDRFRHEILCECGRLSHHTEMLEIVTKLQCPWIFKEAMTHVVGRNNEDFAAIEKQIKTLGLQNLVRNKRKQLATRVQSVMSSLLLRDLRGRHSNNMHCRSYALALLHYRNEVFEHFGVVEQPARIALDGNYASLFVQFSGETRIEDFVRRCEESPVTESRGQYRSVEFDRYVHRIFERVDPMVQGITMSYSEVVKTIPWEGNLLLCTRISEKDLPWNAKR